MAYDNEDINDRIRITDEEDEDYNAKEDSINEIVLRQIRKIGDLCCQEFMEGYWEKKPIKTSDGIMFTKEYHQDTMASFCNAIDFIVSLTYPFGDDVYRTKIDELKKLTLNNMKEKLENRQKIFDEINLMFERTNYFNTNINVTSRAR